MGANAFKGCNLKNGAVSYSGYGDVIATNERYSLAGTQTHHTIMGRTSIVKETTYDFWKDNHQSNHEAYNPKVKLHSHDDGGTSELNDTAISF